MICIYNLKTINIKRIFLLLYFLFLFFLLHSEEYGLNSELYGICLTEKIEVYHNDSLFDESDIVDILQKGQFFQILRKKDNDEVEILFIVRWDGENEYSGWIKILSPDIYKSKFLPHIYLSHYENSPFKDKISHFWSILDNKETWISYNENNEVVEFESPKIFSKSMTGFIDVNSTESINITEFIKIKNDNTYVFLIYNPGAGLGGSRNTLKIINSNEVHVWWYNKPQTKIILKWGHMN